MAVTAEDIKVGKTYRFNYRTDLDSSGDYQCRAGKYYVARVETIESEYQRNGWATITIVDQGTDNREPGSGYGAALYLYESVEEVQPDLVGVMRSLENFLGVEQGTQTLSELVGGVLNVTREYEANENRLTRTLQEARHVVTDLREQIPAKVEETNGWTYDGNTRWNEFELRITDADSKVTRIARGSAHVNFSDITIRCGSERSLEFEVNHIRDFKLTEVRP